MSTFPSLALIVVVGCSGASNASGVRYDFRVTPFGGVNDWRSEPGVDVNVDGLRVGVTGEGIEVPPGEHTVTFGDMSDTTTTSAGVTLPVITSASGQRWFHDPIVVNSDADRARSEADTALTDTASPPADAGNGTAAEVAVDGTFLTSGTWTCQDQWRIETRVTEVSYPDSGTMDMPIFGSMDIIGVLLHIPDDGTSELRGNFTGDATLTVNVIPSDGGSDVGIFDCWFGTLCDRPWDPYTDTDVCQ